MVTKGHLGVGYLAGTGIGFVGVLVWRFPVTSESRFMAFVGTTTGTLLAVSLVYLAYWLTRSELEDDHIWAVSRWGAVGLAITAIPILAVAVFQLEAARYVEPSVLGNIAVAGAVIGSLFGAVTELEIEYDRTRALNDRNVVMNRVLRHNVRNDASVVLLYVQRLEDELDAASEEFADPIRGKIEEILTLSKTARWIDDLDRETTRRPVDVVEIVEDRVEMIRRTRPAVVVETDLPAEAWVDADSLLGTVIDNVVENAIEHNDRSPEVRISVRTPSVAAESVEISVADNGPGIPAESLRPVLRGGEIDPGAENPGAGLGLWLVRWFVDAYGGDLAFEENDPRGTVVRITLPAATVPGEQSPTAEAAI